MTAPDGFPPTVGELDLHLFGEGRHRRLWEVLGAHVRTLDGVDGTSFAVWAPNARSVGVALLGDGDGGGGDGDGEHALRRLGPGGVWEGFLPGVGAGARYQLEVEGADGERRRKADPFASCTADWGAVSVVHRSTHRWTDGAWIDERRRTDPLTRPLSVYEVHLGSWRQGLSYRQLAEELVAYVVALGFTHVELLPVAEHPYDPSWGYQVTGLFAPTARYGPPDDFRAFVDACHGAGVGVLVDWVPAHFPRDDWALARFDGTPLYEHADPRRAEHPDWGTLEYDLGRSEVRNVLVASAQYWLEELHVDGLRVDAVASMLYLDYSRGEGQWAPNRHGGREDLEAVAFLQEVNSVAQERSPGVLTVAEESTTWPGVSAPVTAGGLGFGAKWDMGWMHDTLEYFSQDPVHRRWSHHLLTFGLTYVFGERYVLPLSHDEVVHEKRSLLSKLPGDRWQQLANLRALLTWMWCHPGAPLLFMGGELGQEREWSEARSLDWHLLDDPGHAGLQRLVGDLNRVRASEPALWSGAFDPAGFRWIDPDDVEQSCYSFLRLPVGAVARPLACLANLTPVPRYGYRVGLPEGGAWSVVLDSDASEYGGAGVVVGPSVATEGLAWHGFPHSAVLTLPPLAVVWLAGPTPPRGP